MKKYLIIIFTIMIIIPVSVCAEDIKESIFTWGGSGSDSFNSTEPTKDGGFIVVGSSSSTDAKTSINGNEENMKNNGMQDAIIIKYDKNGTVEWQKNYGGKYADFFYDVVATEDGGYIAVGEINSSIPNGVVDQNYQTKTDGVIVKFNQNGEIEWEDRYIGNLSDSYSGVTITKNGDIIVVGYSYSNTDDVTVKGSYDAIIVSYKEKNNNGEKKGEIQWIKSYGESAQDFLRGVAATDDGGFVAVGGTVPDQVPYAEAVIIKYNSFGEIIWKKLYGGTKDDNFDDVITTNEGDYVVVGVTSSDDINGITKKGSEDALLLKYDKNGNVVWQKNYGEANKSYFLAITPVLNEIYDYIVVGHVNTTNPETNTSDDDTLIAAYDNNDIIWQKKHGGSAYDSLNGITIINNRDIIAVGTTYSSNVSDVVSKGSNDAIVIKLYREKSENDESNNDEENKDFIENPDDKENDEVEIENPETSVNNPYFITISIFIVCLIFIYLIKRKKYI